VGTDIHLAAEVRTNGQWDYVKTYEYFWDHKDETNPLYDSEKDPTERYYSLFRFLCGVRGEWEEVRPALECIGLPKDNAGIYEDYDSVDDLGDHSQTWASYEQLRDINWPEELRGCGFYWWLQNPLKQLAEKVGPTNLRILIGFDS